MVKWLFQKALEKRNPIARKGAAYLLQLGKLPLRALADDAEYKVRPPIIVNSLPKSGTHLLLQMARAIPNTRYLGGFVAHAWSVTLRERSPEAICRRLNLLLPGEVVGAHIKYHPTIAEWFRRNSAIHLFIYRDPRDVVLSEESYLMEMAPWHRLHRVLRHVPEKEERLRLLIEGVPEIYPDIRSRVRSFVAWLEDPSVIGVRYEDLISPSRRRIISRLAEQICACAPSYGPSHALADRMEHAIDPQRSITFREGGAQKWRYRMSQKHVDLTEQMAGNEIRRLGYVDGKTIRKRARALN